MLPHGRWPCKQAMWRGAALLWQAIVKRPPSRAQSSSRRRGPSNARDLAVWQEVQPGHLRQKAIARGVLCRLQQVARRQLQVDAQDAAPAVPAPHVLSPRRE